MRPYEQFRDELVDISRDFSRCPSVEYRVLENRMPRLMHILFNHDFSHAEMREIRALFEENEELVREVFLSYAVQCELKFARRFSAAKYSGRKRVGLAALVSVLDEIYRPFTLMSQCAAEVKLANIRKDDHVLFIGSGPVPLTAIAYVMLTGCMVDCYEKSAENAEASRRLFEKINLDHKIKVHTKDGRSLGGHSYDVVIVGGLARPVADILAVVRKTSPIDTKVVFRSHEGRRRLFSKIAGTYICRRVKHKMEGFTIVRRVNAPDSVSVSSLLFINSKTA